MNIEAIKEAALRPELWRTVPASQPDSNTAQNDTIASRLDELILSISDLVPAQLEWRTVQLCEALINPGTDGRQHFAQLNELMSFVPGAFTATASALIDELHKIGGREVVTRGLSFPAQLSTAIRQGYVLV